MRRVPRFRGNDLDVALPPLKARRRKFPYAIGHRLTRRKPLKPEMAFDLRCSVNWSVSKQRMSRERSWEGRLFGRRPASRSSMDLTCTRETFLIEPVDARTYRRVRVRVSVGTNFFFSTREQIKIKQWGARFIAAPGAIISTFVKPGIRKSWMIETKSKFVDA